MSQDDQNRDRKNEGEGWEASDTTPRPDQTSDLENVDEMDEDRDEDRDEDDRAGYGGGSNRRRSIN